MGSISCVDRWGKLGKTSLGDGKCQCKVFPLPSLLFAFHTEWQITRAKPLQGAAPRLFIFAWDSVTVTPHSHANYLLISLLSHIPIYPSPPPNNLPSSPVMNSFSRLSLPITSPPSSSSSFTFSVCLNDNKEKLLEASDGAGTFYVSRGDWPKVPLSLFTARGDRCMLVCSAAWGGEWVYLISSHLPGHANVTSAPLVAGMRRAGKTHWCSRRIWLFHFSSRWSARILKNKKAAPANFSEWQLWIWR